MKFNFFFLIKSAAHSLSGLLLIRLYVEPAFTLSRWWEEGQSSCACGENSIKIFAWTSRPPRRGTEKKNQQEKGTGLSSGYCRHWCTCPEPVNFLLAAWEKDWLQQIHFLWKHLWKDVHHWWWVTSREHDAFVTLAKSCSLCMALIYRWNVRNSSGGKFPQTAWGELRKSTGRNVCNPHSLKMKISWFTNT